MPGAVDDELLLEVGQNPFHVGDALGADQASDECGNQGHRVADVIEDAVGSDIRRRAGSAETAHIRCDDMVARSSNCPDLMPPGIG